MAGHQNLLQDMKTFLVEMPRTINLNCSEWHGLGSWSIDSLSHERRGLGTAISHHALWATQEDLQKTGLSVERST
jgi:hypothetical protein